MITTPLTGRIDVALGHFALVGVAAIATDFGRSARFAWSDELRPRPLIHSEEDLQGLAQLVGAHARAHATSASWVQQVVHGGPRAEAGLFTVRAKAIQPDGWAAIQEQRRVARSELITGALDERLIGALGEPAWWLFDTNGRSMDDGGSRWEMKTRNRGEEFIVNRLAPLAAALANRASEQIADGLAGMAVNDETGGGINSRTSTGLTTPGPTDSAVAWCALWGLHVMPTIPRRNAISQTACVWPRRGVHPQVAALPVFTDPVTPRRFAEICADRRMEEAWRALGAVESDAGKAVRADAAQTWLREQGVRAVMRFPIRKTGSSSAPERQMLAGEQFVLSGRGETWR